MLRDTGPGVTDRPPAPVAATEEHSGRLLLVEAHCSAMDHDLVVDLTSAAPA